MSVKTDQTAALVERGGGRSGSARIAETRPVLDGQSRQRAVEVGSRALVEVPAGCGVERPVPAEAVIGVEQHVGVDLIALARDLLVGALFGAAALGFRIRPGREDPDVVVVFLQRVAEIAAQTSDQRQPFVELEADLDIAVYAVVLEGRVVVVERPPGVLGIGRIIVVGVVVDAVVVFQIAVVDVNRILENVLIDRRAVLPLTRHGVAHILADVGHAVVQPCETSLDLRVAAEREGVALEVVVVARKNAVRIGVAVGCHESAVGRAALHGDRVVRFEARVVEVFQRIFGIGKRFVGHLGPVVPRRSRTPVVFAAVEDVAPGAVFRGREVAEITAVVIVVPPLAELVLQLRDAQRGAGHERAVVGDGDILVLASPLGGDDDHAVAGARAVERRRRGSLQDRDRLDVLRIDIGRLVAEVDRVVQILRSHRGVGYGNAVDDIERLVAAGQRRIAADDDLLRGARAARRGDLHAGDLADQTGHGVGGVSLGDLIRLDRGRGVAERAFLPRDAQSRDDDVVQSYRIVLHGDIDGRFAVDRNALCLHADKGNLQNIAGADIQRIFAVRIRTGADMGTFDDDRSACDRLAVG